MICINIKATNSDLLGSAFLIGHVKGQIFCFKDEIETINAIAITKISIPSQIAYFTLFDSENILIAERLFNESGITTNLLGIKPNQVKYQPREKIQLDLTELFEGLMAIWLFIHYMLKIFGTIYC